MYARKSWAKRKLSSFKIQESNNLCELSSDFNGSSALKTVVLTQKYLSLSSLGILFQRTVNRTVAD